MAGKPHTLHLASAVHAVRNGEGLNAGARGLITIQGMSKTPGVYLLRQQGSARGRGG